MKDDITLEKLKIHERLMVVEKYITEGNVLRSQIRVSLDKLETIINNLDHKINGNGEIGLDERVKDLEKQEVVRSKVKDGVIKLAVGSLTMAIGAFVIWFVKLIWMSIKH